MCGRRGCVSMVYKGEGINVSMMGHSGVWSGHPTV